MKVFELKKRKDLSHAIHAIALVEHPAIEEDFIYLSKDGKKAESNIYLSEEKGIIYTPVLIPEQRIRRVNKQGQEYEIFFSADTIRESAYDMMKALTPLGNFNEEHSSKKINDVNVVELWIVEDAKMDKATKLGFDVVDGTMMAGIKVDNEQAKADIKSGKLKGISIEGLYEDFEEVELTVNLNTTIMNDFKKTVDELITQLKAIVPTKDTKLAMVQVDENTALYTEGDFAEGVMVYTDEALTVPASGTFEADGLRMVIEDGSLVSVQSLEELKEKEEMQQTTELAEAVKLAAEKTVLLSEALEAVKKENESLKSELTELSKIKETVEEHTTLLAKVKDATVESKVELKAEHKPQSSYLNSRKQY